MEDKLKELEALQKLAKETKITPSEMTDAERVQAQKIFKAINQYIKQNDNVSLQKYLIHTRNELRRTNR